MNTTFEDEYLDHLFSIENAIVSTYKKNTTMLDYDVESAIQALTRHYNAEINGRTAPIIKLSAIQKNIYDSIRIICDFQIGKTTLKNSDGTEITIVDLGGATISKEEAVLCFKRIAKSVTYWGKQGGRRGYLTFVSDQFSRIKPFIE